MTTLLRKGNAKEEMDDVCGLDCPRAQFALNETNLGNAWSCNDLSPIGQFKDLRLAWPLARRLCPERDVHIMAQARGIGAP